MLQRSPILRFALEVFDHSLANATSTNPRDWKMAVMSLAQSVELAVKAALVEQNVPIYDKKAGMTITIRDALGKLAELWDQDRVDMHSRLELLVDERNAIQHKYGAIDEVTLDYHMETVFAVLRELLQREFDIELDDWIRGEVDQTIWKKVRFVPPLEPVSDAPSASASPDRSATLDLIAGFVSYEQSVRKAVESAGADPTRLGSTLDFVLKALANAPEPDRELVGAIPAVYRLRNRVVHGFGTAANDDVSKGLAVLDRALAALNALPRSTVAEASEASSLGVRGTRIKGLAPRECDVSPEFAPLDECEETSQGG